MKASTEKRRYEIISALPSGKNRMVSKGEGRYDYTGASWRASGGYRGGDSIRLTVKKLKALGFERTDMVPGGLPDGSTCNNTTHYIDSDGNVVSTFSHFGVESYDNRFRIEVTFADKSGCEV